MVVERHVQRNYRKELGRWRRKGGISLDQKGATKMRKCIGIVKDNREFILRNHKREREREREREGGGEGGRKRMQG